MRWFLLSLLILLTALTVRIYKALPTDQLSNIPRQLPLQRLIEVIRTSARPHPTRNNNIHSLRSLSTLTTTSASAKMTTTTQPRAIRQVFLAEEQSEGVGARVRRSIGTRKLRNFSPFLMLDHFSVSPGAGFPDHPHRGQETITYLLHGAFDHEDFAGNRGTINTGDLQFMTAGRGIMHAEMPHQNADGSANVGLQLWVDLPERLKLVEPRYRDLRAHEIPVVDVDGGRAHVKVISGQSHGVDSVRDLAYTPVWILDVDVKPGGKIQQALPAGWNGFAYTLSGTTTFGAGKDARTVGAFHNVVFEQDGDVVIAEVDASAKENGHFGGSNSSFSPFLHTYIHTFHSFLFPFFSFQRNHTDQNASQSSSQANLSIKKSSNTVPLS